MENKLSKITILNRISGRVLEKYRKSVSSSSQNVEKVNGLNKLYNIWQNLLDILYDHNKIFSGDEAGIAFENIWW